ncbi:hypothetical protein DND58_28055 [Pseudomonas syringae pv. pisi]|uniref:Uncharacterized protein n=1 Tax=Pseudomonas savastanoi pv. phaseolicola TaxID=319 RepID=A0A7Z6USI9_PSESH|nr:hypothetical protein DND58_28055 [Pseudomonas syringae pv. pisi]RMU87273.1 hypothetical protein ALP21_200322 [Pseudomonas savastanoi pv. phaseolicola]
MLEAIEPIRRRGVAVFDPRQEVGVGDAAGELRQFVLEFELAMFGSGVRFKQMFQRDPRGLPRRASGAFGKHEFGKDPGRGEVFVVLHEILDLHGVIRIQKNQQL